MTRTKPRKIVILGGGSSYTPEIMEGLIAWSEELSLGEVWLVDIEEGKEKLETVGKLVDRIVEQAERPFSLRLSLDRREALSGADFVITQMRVGGIHARVKDERIPLRYGVIGQETTGPGGFAKALRTIPVMLAVCRELGELAPEAWLINFTNPSGIMTEAISRHTSTKVVGLCNIPINTEKFIHERYKAKPEEMFIQFVGCNHLVWVNRVLFHGNDVTHELLTALGKEEKAEWPLELLESLGAIPCAYHHFFYKQKEVLTKLKQADAEGKPTRAETILELEKELFDEYGNTELKKKPEALSKRGGSGYAEAALRLISSICHDRRDIQCVDTTNRGALSDLPDDSVVEVNCVIGAQGPVPLVVGSLPPQIRGLLQQIKAYEELTVQAAVTGDRNVALQALLANPLVPSAGVAKVLLDALLEAHKEYLPQFA